MFTIKLIMLLSVKFFGFVHALVVNTTNDCDLFYSQHTGLSASCQKNDLSLTHPNQISGFSASSGYFMILIRYKNFRNLTEPVFDGFEVARLYLDSNQIELISMRTFATIRNLYELKLNHNLIGPLAAVQLTLSPTASLNLKVSLNDNSIHELNQTISGYLSNTAELYLSSNELRYICPDAFVNFYNLRVLDLSSNYLEYLNETMFHNLANLNTLNLNDNNLKRIQTQTFVNLKSLINLNLNRNLLDHIDSNAISTNVQNVDLSFNKFESLTCVNLGQLSDLSKLNMRGNYLKHLNLDHLASLKSLNKLDVSFNQMELIQSDTTKMFLSRVDFSYSSLTEFDLNFYLNKLTGLEVLDLKYNQIKKINVNECRASNETWVLRPLSVLMLRNNLIECLEVNSFRGLFNLTQLMLDNNLIRRLIVGVFTDLVKLYELTLEYNLIEQLESGVFASTVRLAHLTVHHNRIVKIECGTFANLASLVELDLSNNKIESIKWCYFQNLSSLLNLQLSNNLIIDIEPGAFSTLGNLRYLLVVNNDISNIRKGTFSRLNLNILNLELNDIETIEPGSFDNASIREVNFNSNYIQNSMMLLANIGDFVKVVSLSDNEYTSFVVERLTPDEFRSNIDKIDLSCNKIGVFKFKSKQFGSIRAVNLSSNLIESISIDDFKSLVSLTDLDLSNNRLKYIEGEFFSLFKFRSLRLNNSLYNRTFELDKLGPNLTEIDVGNNRLTDLRWNGVKVDLEMLILTNLNITFDGSLVDWALYPNLVQLDLSYNRLTFDPSLLSSLGRLVILNLKATGLESVKNVQFNLISLTDLNLSSNSIETIERDFFRNITRLRHLDLSENRIEFLAADTFNDLNWLIMLNLSYNRLRKFYFQFYAKQIAVIYIGSNMISEYFKNSDTPILNTLQTLDFSFNNLSEVEFKCMINSESTLLTKVYLNNNLIGRIKSDVFDQMIMLKELDLSYNQVETIEDVAFLNQKVLEWLDLSNNMLTLNSNENLFNTLTRLTYLNMSSNRIELINERIFSRLYNLHQLDLSRNRLKFIQSYSFDSLKQLVFLDLSNNEGLALEEMSLSGLESIKDLWISFDQLDTKTLNQLSMINSLRTVQVRNVDEVVYYRSIYVNYRESKVDCLIVLNFIRHNIQLNLKTEQDFSLFTSTCHFLDFNIF